MEIATSAFSHKEGKTKLSITIILDNNAHESGKPDEILALKHLLDTALCRSGLSEHTRQVGTEIVRRIRDLRGGI